uniref:Uncharacterized domain 1 n=1 Tax=Mycobacterium sp. (strain JLS) TaxID=164757 RepID=A0A5Q5CKN7_MYCSJ
MSGLIQRATDHDIETPDSIQVRFGIEFVEQNPADATAVLTMPMSGFRNPFTESPAVGPLAILVDAAGGIVNHYRRRDDQWTVSSELSLELSSHIGDDIDGPVVATARTLGPVGATSLSICTLSCGDTVIGGGTVRSYYIPTDGVIPDRPEETLARTAQTTLADLMAVWVNGGDDRTSVLRQGVDRNLNNDIGIVHGGVAAAGLELAASAAINKGRSDGLLQTASLRVNFLRPFFAGRESRYVGTALRVGRSTAVGDAQAIGDDGKAAITARVTAYR